MTEMKVMIPRLTNMRYVHFQMCDCPILLSAVLSENGEEEWIIPLKVVGCTYALAPTTWSIGLLTQSEKGEIPYSASWARSEVKGDSKPLGE